MRRAALLQKTKEEGGRPDHDPGGTHCGCFLPDLTWVNKAPRPQPASRPSYTTHRGRCTRLPVAAAHARGPRLMNMIVPSRPNPYIRQPAGPRGASARRCRLDQRAAGRSGELVRPALARAATCSAPARTACRKRISPPTCPPTRTRGPSSGFCRVEAAEERAVFAVDLSAVEDPAPLLPAGVGEFAELRMIGPGLPPDQAVHPGPCPRADALAHAAPFLRRLRRNLRAACRRERHGLHRLQDPPFPAHGPGGHHADHPRRPCPARPLGPLRPGDVFHPGRLRGAGREPRGSGGAGKCWRKAASRSGAWPTTAASPGRSPPASCSASTARR